MELQQSISIADKLKILTDADLTIRMGLEILVECPCDTV